jgi:hypothetical protein
MTDKRKSLLRGLVEELRWYNYSFLRRATSRKLIEMANKEINSNLPSYDEVAEAFKIMMEGVKEWEIQEITGLGEEECSKIFQTYQKLCSPESQTSTTSTPHSSTSSPTSRPPSSP